MSEFRGEEFDRAVEAAAATDDDVKLARFIAERDGLAPIDLAGEIIRDFWGPVNLAGLIDELTTRRRDLRAILEAWKEGRTEDTNWLLLKAYLLEYGMAPGGRCQHGNPLELFCQKCGA